MDPALWAAVFSRSFRPFMTGWLISPRSGAAYLDLRASSLTLDRAAELLEELVPYYDREEVKLVVIDVRGRSLLNSPIDLLVA